MVVEYEEESAQLTVDARDSNDQFLNSMTLEANVVAPDNSVTNLTLHQIAPGQYEAEFVPEMDGAYFIRVAGTAPGDGEAVIGQTGGWVLGYSPEYSQFEMDSALLAGLAEVTGGRDLADTDTETASAAIFDHNLPTQAAVQPIWPWLTLLALILLPVDIALRRLVITRRDMDRAWAATFSRWRPRTTVAEARTEQVSRLFQAKQRAGTKRRDKDGTDMVPPPGQPPTTRDTAVSPTPPVPSPSQSPPTASGSLASRLLEKKRQQRPDEGKDNVI